VINLLEVGEFLAVGKNQNLDLINNISSEFQTIPLDYTLKDKFQYMQVYVLT